MHIENSLLSQQVTNEASVQVPNLCLFVVLFLGKSIFFYTDIILDVFMLQKFYSTHFSLFCVGIFFTLLPIVSFFIQRIYENKVRSVCGNILLVAYEVFGSVLNFSLWEL